MTVKVSKPAVNLREELADLKKPTGIAGEAMLRAETPQEQQALIGLGQRNMIINGDFQVWQRGASGTSGYVADRWNGINCSSQSKQYDADVGNYIQFTATNAAVMYYGIELPETGKVTPFEVGQTYTVSLKVKSDALMHKPNVSFRDGIGGGTNTSFTSIEIKPHMATGEWEDVVYQFTVTSAPHSTAILFELTLVSFEYANTPINIAQVQIVKGKVATPFEHRSYGEELAACQRYFQRLKFNGGYSKVCLQNGTTTGLFTIEYSTKRSIPTIVTVPTPTTSTNQVNGISLLTSSGSYRSATGSETVTASHISEDTCRINLAGFAASGSIGDATWGYFTTTSNPSGCHIDVQAEL